MVRFGRARWTMLLAAATLLSGCAYHATISLADAPPAAIPPRPALPGQYTAVVLPPRTADGGWRTLNGGIDAEQTAWHVRAALNVAAIGCRGSADAGLTPAYNALLAGQKAALARANASVQAGFRQRFGAGWQTAHDAYMTRLYNFFAQPFAKAEFCAAADAVAPAAAVAQGGFEAFAATALPRLEAPFTAVYARIADTRIQMAAWDARYGPGARTMLAQASPPTVLPRLAYTDLGVVMAWEPRRGTTLASR